MLEWLEKKNEQERNTKPIYYVSGLKDAKGNNIPPRKAMKSPEEILRDLSMYMRYE